MTVFQREIGMAIWQALIFVSCLIYAIAYDRGENVVALVSALFGLSFVIGVVRVMTCKIERNRP